jgi:predicted amidohydrolase YtcJ
MLIRNAEVWRRGMADVRISGETISEIGSLLPMPDEAIVDARGGALLPGLHDHHIHMAASAVRVQSIVCGPPEINTADELASRLSIPGLGWLRGILYHESVMGLPNAKELDHICSDRPLRIQHRSGRMWLFNSRALDLLLSNASPPPGLERVDGHFSGRLFDEDGWLQTAMQAQPPSLADISAELARSGVTGVTDMSPRNDGAIADWFASECEARNLEQRCILAGTLALAEAPHSPRWQVGPVKLHLHENALPDFDQTVALIRAAHEQGRGVASHCTTETELVFTLAALDAAGAMPGDRIEHAGIVRDDHVGMIADMELSVVSQPHFIAERGDHYLTDVDPDLHADLYRLSSFRDAGVSLAAGSDAPFGSLDPWAAMAAAVSRRTKNGQIIGAKEALTPEQALKLYLSDPEDLSLQRSIKVGAAADLCLLDCNWQTMSQRLDSSHVAATVIAGELVDNFVDQAPIQGLSGR